MNNELCKTNELTEKEAEVKTGGRITFQLIATITVNLLTAAYGFGIAWPSFALPILQKPNSDLHLTQEEASWVASLLCVGGLASTPLVSFLPDYFGRKKTGYLLALPITVAWLLINFVQSVISLYIARFLIGVTGAGIIILAPLYVVEIAEDNVRGALGTLCVIFCNAGIALSYVLSSFLSYECLNYVNLCLPTLFIMLFFFLPETPQYLITCNKTEEAATSLRWFRGKDRNITNELECIKSLRTSEMNTSSSLKNATSRANVRGLILIMVLCANQQLSGIFPILSYTVTIFEESGSDLSPNIATITVGLLQLSTNVLSLFLVERAGRKVLLIISNFLMSLSLIALGTYFYLRSANVSLENVDWLPITSLSIYIFAISIGIGPLLFVIVTEIISPSKRQLAYNLGYSLIWIFSFSATKFFNNLSDLIGIYGPYWIFSACCILGMLVIIFQLPETKGRSLESIIEELNK